MAGSRSLGIRFGMVLLICACALASSLPLAGCDSDVEAPPQMTPPVAPLEPWFYSVWGGGTDDVYVVGQPGLIYHYNGTAWAQQTSGTDEPLTDVWSPNGGQTFYACGHNGIILIKTNTNNFGDMKLPDESVFIEYQTLASEEYFHHPQYQGTRCGCPSF